MIDRHNRYRQDDLKIERKYGTHDWSMRLNILCLPCALLMPTSFAKLALEATRLPMSSFGSLQQR